MSYNGEFLITLNHQGEECEIFVNIRNRLIIDFYRICNAL